VGKTVLFSTHIMEHAEQLCDRLCIIARGKKLIDATLAEVKRTHGGQHLIVAFDGSPGWSATDFSTGGSWAKIQDSASKAELELANGPTPRRSARMVESGARLARFELASPSLSQDFVDLVGPEAATQPPFSHDAKESAPVHKIWAVIRRDSWSACAPGGFDPAILDPVLFVASSSTRSCSPWAASAGYRRP